MHSISCLRFHSFISIITCSQVKPRLLFNNSLFTLHHNVHLAPVLLALHPVDIPLFKAGHPLVIIPDLGLWINTVFLINLDLDLAIRLDLYSAIKLDLDLVINLDLDLAIRLDLYLVNILVLVLLINLDLVDLAIKADLHLVNRLVLPSLILLDLFLMISHGLVLMTIFLDPFRGHFKTFLIDLFDFFKGSNIFDRPRAVSSHHFCSL